jgi:hypothetical protein
MSYDHHLVSLNEFFDEEINSLEIHSNTNLSDVGEEELIIWFWQDNTGKQVRYYTIE